VEHLSTFGLDRDPFGGDAQLAWYYEGAAFLDATQRLHRAALQAKGLCIVTGRGGVGKTMLVRHLLQALEDEVFEASMLVAVPGITDLRWILTRWAQQLGVETPSSELGSALAQVYEQLAIVREDGRNGVLIIDEAQVLAERGMLAELRGLLNLEYEERKLVTLVLVGSPSLADAAVAEPSLAERVDLRLTLPPLQTKEVAGYLHHRIRVAGGNPAIFESAAVTCLTKHCGGVPRRINALADNALFEAHRAGRVSATAADVERAATDLSLTSPPEPVAAPIAARASAHAPAREPEPHASERAFAAPSPARREPARALLEDSAELELGEVIAEGTSARRGAALTTALLDEAPSHGKPDADGGFSLDDPNELEDLFADIVDE